MTGTTLRRGYNRGERSVHPVLRVVCTPDTELLGATFPLNGEFYLFGRSRDAEHRLRDGRMSRAHARIQPSNDTRYTVEDLDTTNGTFLDGRRVRGRRPLEGTVLSMGDTLMVVDRPPDRDLLPAAPEIDPSSVRSIYGLSLATSALRASVATVGPQPGAVLLLGPTGVGKEVTADAIHQASRREGAFVAVNCAAVPETLAESAFFGYYKGAFSGADKDQKGHFQASSGGTLFLDEVGEMPLPLQAKLLRVLETQVVQPVGHGPPEKVDVRVVSATNADLKSTDFRPDLLARLSEWELRIPPLMERKADILELWRVFLERGPSGRSTRGATAEFCEALLLHDWPMNARELRNLARRLDGLVGSAAEFQLQDLPSVMQAPLMPRFEDGSAPSAPARQASAPTHPPSSEEPSSVGSGGPSRDVLESALAKARGNVKAAAETNNWHRTQLYRWLKRHDIDPDKFR